MRIVECRIKSNALTSALRTRRPRDAAVMRLPNADCIHYNSVIDRSDAAYKECENPFSPTTRPLRNKEGRQVSQEPTEAECWDEGD